MRLMTSFKTWEGNGALNNEAAGEHPALPVALLSTTAAAAVTAACLAAP